MLHAGDAVGASSPVSALLQDEPTIEILNEIGFDIGTFGNHEFDEGVTEMLRLINGGSHPKTVEKYGVFEGASFPYISANVINSTTKEPLIAPYLVKRVNGVPIGFIGVTLSDTPSIVTPSGVAGVEFTDETEAINKYTSELKSQGVEAIVVIAHNPILSNIDGTNPTEELASIAEAIDDEVDVLFGGHNHQYANTTVDGKLIVQSFSSGTAFSDVDLLINPKTKDIYSKKAEIVNAVRTITPDAKVKSIVDLYMADVASTLNEVIGSTPAGISRTENADGESQMGNLIADSMKAQTGTDFAFMNPGGIRANECKHLEGSFHGSAFERPCHYDIDWCAIKTLFEQQWGSKERILKISGLKVAFNSSLEKGNRVVSITKNDGTLLANDQVYSVTVNNFMADGGDELHILKEGNNRIVNITDLDALINYIKAKGEVNPEIDGRITRQNK
jgi:2',3'-cyclic-nucleotide 2'-phosphodiesterase/3'-nucleotidase/5'-nucleotidase